MVNDFLKNLQGEALAFILKKYPIYAVENVINYFQKKILALACAYAKRYQKHLCQEAILQPRPYDESVSTPVQTRDPSWVQDRNGSGTVATNQLARPRPRSNCSHHEQCKTAEG